MRSLRVTVAVIVCAALAVSVNPVAGAQSVVVGPSSRPVPSAVAIANDGTAAAAGFGAPDAVGIMPLEGPGLGASLGCVPVDVAIAPDASYAWAVCQGDSHIYVIDVDTAGVASAGIGTVMTDDIVYVPSVRRLIVADLEGEIVVVSARSIDDYRVIDRIATPDFRPTELAPLPDGSGTYAVSDSGRLAYIDFASGSVTNLTAQGPTTLLQSLTLSRTGTRLYAGAIVESRSGEQRSAVVALDPATGRLMQELPLEFTQPGFTGIKVAAGHRSLSVGTGLGVLVDGQASGALEIALDSHGRMGEVRALFSYTAFSSDVGRSSNGDWAVVATTDATVVVSAIEDSPYPPQISLKGSLRAKKLTLTGATGGMRPGTRISVHVKDLTKGGSRFVQQAVRAEVSPTGTFRWKGKVPSGRVLVYMAAKGATSKSVTVKGR